jgi:hypothetical protein
MSSESESRVHLHVDDHPQALAILASLLGHRVARAGEVGYEPTEHGAWVDWAALEHSWLSSTECAAVVVARGIAMAERRAAGHLGCTRSSSRRSATPPPATPIDNPSLVDP